MADPTPLDLTPITHSHHPTRTAGVPTCREDEQDWPCQTAQLASEIERLRAAVDRLQEELDGAHNSAWERREHLKASREQGDRLRAELAQARRQTAEEIATALDRNAAEYPTDSDTADTYRDAAREAREIGDQP